MSLQLALDSQWYVDSSIYKREQKLIFEPAWWLLGPAQMVLQSGDYICDKICNWPVFAIRSDDGQLRAFLNVCRHRGASVLQEGVGSAKSIRCPYHGWLYDDQGRLVNAPRFGADLKAQCEDISLREIDVHVWKDLVFIKINSENGVEFDEWIGEIDTLCRSFSSPSDLEYYGEFSVTGELNWKTYCDNTVEGYHLNQIHPRLGKTLADGGVKLHSVNDGRSVVFNVTYGNGGRGQELRGRKGVWVYHFPGLQLVLGDKVFKAERVEAIDSDQVRSRNWAWYSGLNDEEKNDAFQWAKQIVEEDFGICTQVTQNMKVGAYIPGPLSPVMEIHVARFQEIVRNLVKE